MCVAVNAVVFDAPTARLIGPPVTVALLSVIVTPVKGTLPVLVTTNV